MAERYGDTFSKPQSPAEVAQDQLRALKLGLDLEHYQIYKRAPKDWQNRWAKNFDASSGRFNFQDQTPGALQSNGGPVTGPAGMILAAGSTVDKPVDLGALTQIETPSEKWARENAGNAASAPQSKTFLPPYLQPGAAGAPQANTNVPGPGAVAPVTPPAPAPAATTAAPSNPFGITEKPSMSLPYYLRNAKKTRGVGGIVAYG